MDNARQKETPAEGRGSKTSPGSVTLFHPVKRFSSQDNHPYSTGTVTVVGGRLSLVLSQFRAQPISMTPPHDWFLGFPVTAGPRLRTGPHPNSTQGDPASRRNRSPEPRPSFPRRSRLISTTSHVQPRCATGGLGLAPR